MKATLIDCCDYRDGQIELRSGLEIDQEVDDADLIEDHLAGWGRANCVVQVDGSYYLAHRQHPAGCSCGNPECEQFRATQS